MKWIIVGQLILGILLISHIIEGQDRKYIGCDITKTCFGLPNGCLDTKSCTQMVTYKYNPAANKGVVSFELFSTSPNRYAAVGFSTNEKMGNDAVAECYNNGPNSIVKLSENPGGYSRNDDIPEDQQKKLIRETASIVDGELKCNFTLPLKFTTGGTSINFEKNQYFLLLAAGPVPAAGSKTLPQHSSSTTEASAGSNNISSPTATTVGGTDNAIDKDTVKQVHAVGMSLAFIFFMPLGTFISRFYKETWANVRCFQRRLWFLLHVCCMLGALVVFLVAYIVMALTYGSGWYFPTKEKEPAYLHNIIGLAAFALLIMQATTHWWHLSNPFLVRVGELSHWAAGTSCYILGLVNLAFTSSLISTGHQCDRSLPVLIWIIIHAIFYFFMTSFISWTDWHLKNGGWRTLFGYPLPLASTEEAPRRNFRKIVLIVFLVVAFLFAIFIAFTTDRKYCSPIPKMK